MLTAFGCHGEGAALAGCVADANSNERLPTRDVVYARPIPATVKVYPVRRPASANGAMRRAEG